MTFFSWKWKSFLNSQECVIMNTGPIRQYWVLIPTHRSHRDWHCLLPTYWAGGRPVHMFIIRMAQSDWLMRNWGSERWFRIIKGHSMRRFCHRTMTTMLPGPAVSSLPLQQHLTPLTLLTPSLKYLVRLRQHHSCLGFLLGDLILPSCC